MKYYYRDSRAYDHIIFVIEIQILLRQGFYWFVCFLNGTYFLLLGYMESQNIAFSFDVLNDPSVASGLTIDTRYYKVYLVAAATPDAAGGSWGVTFTETGTKFDNNDWVPRHNFTNVYKEQVWISNYTLQCSVELASVSECNI